MRNMLINGIRDSSVLPVCFDRIQVMRHAGQPGGIIGHQILYLPLCGMPVTRPLFNLVVSDHLRDDNIASPLDHGSQSRCRFSVNSASSTRKTLPFH